MREAGEADGQAGKGNRSPYCWGNRGSSLLGDENLDAKEVVSDAGVAIFVDDSIRPSMPLDESEEITAAVQRLRVPRAASRTAETSSAVSSFGDGVNYWSHLAI